MSIGKSKKERLLQAIQKGLIKSDADALKFVLDEKKKSQLIKEVIAEIPQLKKGERGEVGEKGESIVGPQGIAGKDGKNGVNGKDGVKGKDAVVDTNQIVVTASKRVLGEVLPQIPTIAQFEQDLPNLGDYLRDGLERLKGSERLSKDAILGLDDYDEVSRLARVKGIGFVGGSPAGALRMDGTNAPIADISWAGFKITNLATPTSDYDASTKKYVDDAIGGENFWDRTGTTLSPYTANDSLASLNDISATSFTIGANTLTSSEWAFLDGQDQAVKTTSSPTFANLKLTAGGGIYPSADSTTALYINKANNATHIMTVDSTNSYTIFTGRVGIGTVSPNTQLELNSEVSSFAPSILLSNGGSTDAVGSVGILFKARAGGTGTNARAKGGIAYDLGSDSLGYGRGSIKFLQNAVANDDPATLANSVMEITNAGDIKLLSGMKFKPSADSTTALNIANAAGTSFVTFNTTNKRVGIGATPLYKLYVIGATAGLQAWFGSGTASGYNSINIDAYDNSAILAFRHDSAAKWAIGNNAASDNFYLTDSGDLAGNRRLLIERTTGNFSIGTGGTPFAQIHQNSGNATATYHKFTAGTTTGVTATDGFDVGIDASGNAELRQRENLPMYFYTNNTLGATLGADLSWDFVGKIHTYNNIATEDYGVPAIVDGVALTAQSASIGTTNFTNAGTAGLYRVNYYLEATTLNAGATSVLATFGYTDDAGATTTVSATLVLTALGRTSGIFYVRLASGNLTYATTLVDVSGLARYALYASVERLN